MVRSGSIINYRIVVAIFFFIVMCNISCALARKAQSKQDKAWKLLKATCESQTCGHLNPAEAYNCINNCTSVACFNKVYSAEPLEDGEIDYKRSRQFITCLRSEQKELLKASKIS